MAHKLTVRRCDSIELRQHVELYHYLRHWPDPRSLPFGYLLEVDGSRYASDGRLNGLIVMKKPQHHRQAGLFGYPSLPTAWQVLDVARVWIHPQWQTHVASRAEKSARSGRDRLYSSLAHTKFARDFPDLEPDDLRDQIVKRCE